MLKALNLQKKEKGDFGYLNYRKRLNLMLTAAAFLVVLIILIIGFIVNKTRNNVFTVAAIVLVLPAAKFAVSYFVLFGHCSATAELRDEVEKNAKGLGICYDCIFSNNKSPIGTLAVVATDSAVCAYTAEQKADSKLFETSLKSFMENDKLHVNVTLYKDKDTFMKRIKTLSVNLDDSEDTKKKIKWNIDSLKNMCL